VETSKRACVYSVGDLTVDVGRRRVTRRDNELHITKLTFDLLVLLAERAPLLATHDDIVEGVWAGRATRPEVIAQRIKILRKELGDSAKDPRYIKVVRGQGCQLLPAVRALAPQPARSGHYEDAVKDQSGRGLALDSNAPRNKRQGLRASALALAATAVAGGLAAWSLLLEPTDVQTPVSRFLHPVSASLQPSLPYANPIAISPDGLRIAYTTMEGLWLRHLSDLEARLIVTTDYDKIRNPFFSPDGTAVGYWVQGKSLEQVTLDDSRSRHIENISSAMNGAFWGSGDHGIFYAANEGVRRIPADGGPSELVAEAGGGEFFGSPQLLPDGETLLLAILRYPEEETPQRVNRRDWNESQIAAYSLATGQRTVLVERGSHPKYSSTGHLVYGLDESLRAIAFDPRTLTVSGQPLTFAVNVQRAPDNSPFSYYDISENGTLAFFRDGYLSSRTRPVWIDRHGGQHSIDVPQGSFWSGHLAPGGEKIVFQRNDGSNQIWLYDEARHVSQRSTPEAGWSYDEDTQAIARKKPADHQETTPIWIDDRHIAYRRTGRTGDIYVRAADGSGPDARLTEVDQGAAVPTDMSPDGSHLIFNRIATLNAGVWTVPIAGNATDARPLIDSPAQEWNASISPNGKWIAYQSDESGRLEVYVRPYPDVDARREKISMDGGTHPRWSHDGAELYYLDLPQSEDGMRGEIMQQFRTGALMMVPISFEPYFFAGIPEKLFENNFIATGWDHHAYDVAPDGRFLMLQMDTRENRGIVVEQNWSSELARLSTAP
jgi:serine/threonine-protein kinase